MSLRFTFRDNGYPALFFSENAGEAVMPAQCFEVCGEQREIHAYLEAIGNGLNDQLQMIYEFESGSRKVGNDFSDSVVRLFFCTAPFKSITQDEFRAKLIIPFASFFK